MAEVGSSASQDEDDEMLHDEAQGLQRHLTPLQKSLLYELTTRKNRIASARSRVAFWQKQQAEQPRDRFDGQILNEKDLDDLISQRKEELIRLQEARQIKLTIVEAANAAHAINASMSAYPPNLHDSGLQDVPISRRPLRYLAAERDELAFELLRTEAHIKEIRTERADMKVKIDALRKQTSTLIAQVQQRVEQIQQEETKELHSTVRRDERSRTLKEALQAARGKREMVKGVLRGLILESGLDWLGNRGLRTLMLDLGDDDLDASDDEPDFDSDSDANYDEEG